MTQNFVSSPTPLLENGKIVANGYSTHMNFVYNKKAVKSKRLKEWDFYQIQSGDFVIQMTIGHITRVAQISATIFNIKTGKRRSVGKLLLNSRKIKNSLSTNPEKPQLLQWFGKKFKVQFEVTNSYRRLTLSELDNLGVRAEIDLTLTNSAFGKEKMVIATPFEKLHEWYLNYKENCFVVNGYCRIDDMEVSVRDGWAVLDWGRGVWPKKHQWVWGNGSTSVNGKPFGFNIGWGFGNTSHATENMFFWDNKAYKLGEVEESRNGNTYLYTDKEKKFAFRVSFIFDNYTYTKAPGVNNTCHQVFGLWQGFVILPDGTKIDVPPFIAFCEHANNSW